MAPRLLPVLAAVALIAAACGSASSTPVPTATSSPAVLVPIPTPVAAPSLPAVDGPQAPPVIGGVDGASQGPQLTIETIDADTIQATIEDPEAKAWRLVVSGTGELGGDRWEIVVETGDVAPDITATEIREGRVVDVMDLSGFYDGTAVAGGCHSSLPVCLDSAGFVLPHDGNGRFSARLELPEAQVPLVIRGGTASWESEPFVLGPWHDTEPFPWGEG